MAVNRGKQFEQRFREDWLSIFPNSFILRLPDQQSGYFGTSKNICDFICYENNTLFLIECKTHKGNTFPLDNLSQYDLLKSYSHVNGIVIGVVIWFYEKDKVVFVSINEIEKMINDGKKSVNVKMLEDNIYNIIDIPSTKLRTYMKSDYSCLIGDNL